MMDNQFHGSVGTYTDITQLKQKEQQVNNLLQEKEQLLKEVHHRIKNHMNTISAILSLRSSYSDDQKLREVLEEVQDKIRLMQNIYQTLYTGDDVGTIHINSFLQQLLHDIESTYIKKQRIHIVTDIEDIEVTSKQSLPIGIIVTELITNSIKYAFENQEEGNVSISIHRSGENWLNINVADSGEGMPEDVVENESYGFGLTLVKGYVQQFEGKMSIDNTNGTSIRITMELE
jgi:two-component sensor histidine kinase